MHPDEERLPLACLRGAIAYPSPLKILPRINRNSPPANLSPPLASVSYILMSIALATPPRCASLGL